MRLNLDINILYKEASSGGRAEEDKLFESIIAILNQISADLTDIPLSNKEYRPLHKGIRKIYDDTKGAFESAFKHKSDKNLHELRKTSKYLMYMIRIMSPVWPEALDPMEKSLDKLTDGLGIDHDLVTLQQVIIKNAQLLEEHQYKLLLESIDDARNNYQKKTKEISKKLFKEDPKSFADRLTAYWKSY